MDNNATRGLSPFSLLL